MCLFDNCVEPTIAKGLCGGHYRQQYRGQKLRPLREAAKAPRTKRIKIKCLVPKCSDLAFNDLCTKHRTYRSRFKSDTQFVVELFSREECDTCGSKDSLAIDHDHKCCSKFGCIKCIRGVLCRNCNFALGHVQDNPETLLALANYLR